MKKKQYDLIINSVYNAPLAIIIFIGFGLLVYTSPTANCIIDSFEEQSQLEFKLGDEPVEAH